nr:uncharacterized protein LOC131277209 [Dasypus novemcinctus]
MVTIFINRICLLIYSLFNVAHLSLWLAGKLPFFAQQLSAQKSNCYLPTTSTSESYRKAQSQLKMKLHLLRKCFGLFLAYLTWASGLVLANSKSWRVWEFDSNIIPIMFIGLWEVFYFQKFNISDSLVELPVHTQLNMSWVISDEIAYGQDLMLLANFMKTIVLVFGSEALWVSWINGPYPDFLQTCYNNAAIFLFLAGTCTLTTVSWNFAVDFLGQTTLNFPENFPVDKEILTRKHLSYVFPLGITTVIVSLISSAMFLCEKYLIKRQNQVKPMNLTKFLKQNI